LQKTILYAVLHWGLGHATRSIPIIHYLIQQKYKVIIVSDGAAFDLLQQEFPNEIFERSCSYDVSYAKDPKLFNWHLAKQIPKFISVIEQEHDECKNICDRYRVDAIISDNRYGFYHKSIPSAFICHQLKLLYPSNIIFEKIVNKAYQKYLQKFNELWVPDLASPNSISGDMSDLAWKQVKYIGIESRFEKFLTEKKYDVVAILSGPEPLRTEFEKEILKKMNKGKGQYLLVRGARNLEKVSVNSNVELVEWLQSKELNKVIASSDWVLARSGYTSVLDLLKLEKKAVLIATPGQVEQEYLAQKLHQLQWFESKKMEDISLDFIPISKTPQLKFGYEFEIIQQFLSC
jgi:uncharacterized protein (TIGR00661 family)